MSDFVREVDEDYRRDQLLGFWRRYGWLILLSAGLIILGVAGYTYYETARQEELEAQATRYMTAQRFILTDQETQAISELEAMLQDKISPGYRALAAMTRAQLLQGQGRTGDALAGYQSIATDPAIPESFQSLALMAATGITHGERTAQEIETALQPVLEDSDFRHSAEELVAAAYLSEGNTAQALPYLRRIRQSEQAPNSLRARAQTLLNALDEEELPDVSGALVETPLEEDSAP